MLLRAFISVFINAIVLQSTLQDGGRSSLKTGGKPGLDKSGLDDMSESRLKKQREKEQLFEAYNLLHSLAQVAPKND